MSKSQEEHGTPTKETSSFRFWREAGVVALISLALFIFLSLHSDAAGMVGIYLSRILRWLLGYAADLVGVSLLLLALAVMTPITARRRWAIFFGLILVYIVVLIGVHLQTAPTLGISSSLIADWWYYSQAPGTGVVGAFLTYWSLKFLGSAGIWLLLGSCSIIAIMLLFKVSISRLLLAPFLRMRNRRPEVEKPLVKKRRTGRRIFQKATRDQKADSFTAAEEANTVEGSTSPARQAALSTNSTDSQAEGQVLGFTRKETKTAVKSQETATLSAPAESMELVPFRQVRSNGKLPPIDVFQRPPKNRGKTFVDQSALLEQTLASFGVEARVVSVCHGPVITRYEIQPGPGIKVSRITNLADDLALALAAERVRIEAPVPGKPVVGVEIPNRKPQTVYIREVVESQAFQNHPSKLAMALGRDVSGEPVVADLKKILHLLIAGATGSGKSVCLNTIIASFLFRATPEEVRLLMIDPKRVELVNYNGIPHLISPVVTDPKKAATALKWAVAEMERRYELFAEAGVRNIDGYNEIQHSSEEGEVLPYIVVIIDELADLMLVAANEVEDAICRLAQMARAAGMFLIIATQRPSVDVITGLIKANIPSRIAFAVSSQVDSRTILDMAGAERLLGKGDMLFYPIGASKAIRAQGAMITERDIEQLVEFWRQQSYDVPEVDVTKQVAATAEIDEVEDELFDDAVRLVIETGQASISMLQRRFRIGYARAARLIDIMELKGIVGGPQGSKPREVLVDSYEEAIGGTNEPQVADGH